MDGIEHSIGGTPWQFRDRYIENSPAFYLDRVVTPLLVVQTAQASSIPAFLGDQTFVALQRLGKEVEYAKYESDGDSFNPYPTQLDFCNRLPACFATYLNHPDP